MDILKPYRRARLNANWQDRVRIFFHIMVLYPRISSTIFAMLGGILVALSLELIVLVISAERIAPWGPIQNVGLLLLLSALGLTLLSFQMQSFDEFLRRYSRTSDNPGERANCFLAWPGRWLTRALLLLVFAATLLGGLLFTQILSSMNG